MTFPFFFRCCLEAGRFEAEDSGDGFLSTVRSIKRAPGAEKKRGRYALAGLSANT